MATLVDRPVAREPLIQMRVKAFFIASSETTAKGNTVKYKLEPVGREIAGATFHLTTHGGKEIHVIAWLAHCLVKSFGGEVRVQVQLLRMIIACQAWVRQQCLLDVFSFSPGALVKMRFNSCRGF